MKLSSTELAWLLRGPGFGFQYCKQTSCHFGMDRALTSSACFVGSAAQSSSEFRGCEECGVVVVGDAFKLLFFKGALNGAGAATGTPATKRKQFQRDTSKEPGQRGKKCPVTRADPGGLQRGGNTLWWVVISQKQFPLPANMGWAFLGEQRWGPHKRVAYCHHCR